MADARLIYTRISTDQKFIRLNEFEQLLFILLIVHSDDYGRLSGDIMALKYILLPSSQQTIEQFEQALNKLVEVELIRFEENKTVGILNFGEYQKAYHRRKLTRHLFSNEHYVDDDGITKIEQRSSKDDEKSLTENKQRFTLDNTKIEQRYGKGNERSEESKVKQSKVNESKVKQSKVKTLVATQFYKSMLDCFERCKRIKIPADKLPILVEAWDIYRTQFDVTKEIMKAEAWLISNNRHKSNYSRFLTNWFNRVLDNNTGRQQEKSNQIKPEGGKYGNIGKI